jgi:outer membrane biosynthesis protein TonB
MQQKYPAQLLSEKPASLWQTAPAWRWFLVVAVITSAAGVGVGLWSNSVPSLPTASTRVVDASIHAVDPVLANNKVPSLAADTSVPKSADLGVKAMPQPPSNSSQVAPTEPQVTAPKREKSRPLAPESKSQPLPKTPEPSPPAIPLAPLTLPEVKTIAPVTSIAEANKNCVGGPLMVDSKRRPQSVGTVVGIVSAQTSRALIDGSMASSHGDQDPKYLTDLLADVRSPNGKDTRVVHIHGVNVAIGDRVVFDWPYADPVVACRYVPSLIKGVLPPLPPPVESPIAPSQ